MAYDRFAAALAARHPHAAPFAAPGAEQRQPQPQPHAHHYRPTAAKERLSSWEKLLAGAGAGAASVCATYPLDLVRARLAVQMAQLPPEAAAGAAPEGATRAYASLPAALAALRAEVAAGGPAALYRGVLPTLLGILPYAGLAFLTFESLKQAHADAHGGAEPGTAHKLVFGGAAGLVGQVATYPLDVVRRRMQTDGFSRIHAHAVARADAAAEAAAAVAAAARGGGGGAGAGMLQTAARIFATEGVRGLFKGVSLNFVKGPIAAGVSFTVFDALKKIADLD